MLAGRLYQLQIRDGDQYMTEAEDNRVNERLIAPPRGRIIDRFGVELANNRRNYRVLLVAEQATEGVEEALDTIGKVIPLTDAAEEDASCTTSRRTRNSCRCRWRKISAWEEFSRINLHLPYLPGVQPDVGETRDYPFDDELVHILGYVAPVSPEDMKDDDDPLLACRAIASASAASRRQFDTHAARQGRRLAASRSTPMAASSASWAMKRACRARMSGSPSTARCSITSPSGWATKAPPAS